jgi:uncharacterized membrane protein YgcG
MRPRLTTARPLLVLALCALSVAAFVGIATAGKTTLSPNPADDPALIKEKLDPNRYDGADGCVRRDVKGMKRLIKFMKRTTKRNTIYGTIRCDGGVHGTGRALDWMLDARKPSQKRLAMTVINTWFAKDKRGRPNALARRMGIQLVIYNCRWWQAGDRGWSPYSACGGRNPDPTQGHIDHIHIELTEPASKLRTSYWQYAGTGAGSGLEGGGNSGGGGGISPRHAEHVHPPLHPPQPSPAE